LRPSRKFFPSRPRVSWRSTPIPMQTCRIERPSRGAHIRGGRL
jgi:hypothetical protein